MGTKERLDLLVTERRLIRSRSRAQRMIMAGRVRVNGETVCRPGHMVDSQAAIDLVAAERYVSRGGDKLAQALDDFRVEPRGRVCLDVGSSTGGFTDCLLQRGAARVHCVDVGRGQLDWRLRNDRRVALHEGLNARYLTKDDIGEVVDLATIDVAFISLRLVLPPVLAVVREEGDVVALVKPQFEAGRGKVTRGGVARDEETHRDVLHVLQSFLIEKTRWPVVGAAFSPLLGPAGNIEFFLHLRAAPASAPRAVDLDALVARAHAALASSHPAPPSREEMGGREDAGRAD